MSHIAMLMSNGYRPDIRAQKEAHTLALAGYRITIIAWDRKREHPAQHTLETIPPTLADSLADWTHRVATALKPVSIIRLHIQAEYRTGRRLLAKIPLFWWKLFQELRRAQPDIVHAHDLDTLPIAYLYHRLTGTPIIYDAREYYPGMVRANVGPAVSQFLDHLDHWLAPQTSAILTVGERLAARYQTMGGNVWIVHNSQPPFNHARLSKTATRQALGIPDNALLIVYVGMLTPDRRLEPLLDAVSQRQDVWLVVGGAGPNLPAVQAAAEHTARIRVIGWVPLDQIPAIVAAGDAVYYGLNNNDPNSFYFMPNLAFFAFSVGRPLITTPVGEIADVVRREQCGIVMDSATSEAACDALQKLQDASCRQRLTDQAFRLGQTQFTWRMAADQLWNAYHSVKLE